MMPKKLKLTSCSFGCGQHPCSCHIDNGDLSLIDLAVKQGVLKDGGERMKPCDCMDMYTVRTKLNEHGIKYNDFGIMVYPSYVTIEFPHGSIKIPQTIFKRFAEWYLQDQEVKE